MSVQTKQAVYLLGRWEDIKVWPSSVSCADAASWLQKLELVGRLGYDCIVAENKVVCRISPSETP